MYLIVGIFVGYSCGILTYEFNVFKYYLALTVIFFVYSLIFKKNPIYKAVILSFVLLSVINCNYNSNSVLGQYENKEIEVVAHIIESNKTNEFSNYNSYKASVLSINNNLLSSSEKTTVYIQKDKKLNENSLVKFYANVSKNNFTKNKLLFNYNNYLKSQKIHASLFVNGSFNSVKENYSFLNKISIEIRNYTEDTFYKNLNKNNANIILSIILGDVDYLDSGLYDTIKTMGLAHIFAVSGSHIVLIYGFLIWLFKFFGLDRKSRWLLSWVIIWMYGIIIGLPISVLRSIVMFTFLFGSEVLYRKYSSLNSLTLSAIILCIYNPFWILDAGFLLSFSAALSLIIYNKYVVLIFDENKISMEDFDKSKKRKIKEILKDKANSFLIKVIYLYVFLQIFTLPVIVYYFNYIPVLGMIYNIIMIPIFTVILIYGFVLLMLNSFLYFLLKLPFKIFGLILDSLRYFISFSNTLSFNGIYVPTMTLEKIIFFYIFLFGVIYLYKNKNLFIKKYSFIVFSIYYAITFILYPIFDDSLYFKVFDVGQGLFTIVNYKNKLMIFDCGSTSSTNFGEYTALPILTKNGFNDVDGMFLSHWDLDHVSGINTILNSKINVEKVFRSFQENEIEIETFSLVKGDKIKIDDNFTIDIIWPPNNYITKNINNSSLVALLQYYDRRILLTGDIESLVEQTLVKEKNNLLNNIDIIIVPHHGSKTSSSSEFINVLKPDYAVLSYGKNNYGIPSNDVIKRYEETGSYVISTYEDGEINFILNNKELYYSTFTKKTSGNYYQLYLEWMEIKSLAFIFLLAWLIVNKNKANLRQNIN